MTTAEHFVFYKNWFDKGIRNIIDIIDLIDNLYEFVQLKVMTGIRDTFLDYKRPISKIHRHWKEKETKMKIRLNVNTWNRIKFILKDKKDSLSIYDETVGAKNIRLTTRWIRVLGQVENEEWENYNSNLKYTDEIILGDFQFKVSNRILVTIHFT